MASPTASPQRKRPAPPHIWRTRSLRRWGLGCTMERSNFGMRRWAIRGQTSKGATLAHFHFRFGHPTDLPHCRHWILARAPARGQREDARARCVLRARAVLRLQIAGHIEIDGTASWADGAARRARNGRDGIARASARPTASPQSGRIERLSPRGDVFQRWKLWITRRAIRLRNGGAFPRNSVFRDGFDTDVYGRRVSRRR